MGTSRPAPGWVRSRATRSSGATLCAGTGPSCSGRPTAPAATARATGARGRQRECFAAQSLPAAARLLRVGGPLRRHHLSQRGAGAGAVVDGQWYLAPLWSPRLAGGRRVTIPCIRSGGVGGGEAGMHALDAVPRRDPCIISKTACDGSGDSTPRQPGRSGCWVPRFRGNDGREGGNDDVARVSRWCSPGHQHISKERAT